MRRRTLFVLTMAWGLHALGVVNPQFQPSHIVAMHRTVIGGEVTEVSDTRIVFRVTQVCLGRFEPGRVTIQVPEVGVDDPSLLDDVAEGATVVAYLDPRRGGNEGVLYAGQQWHQVRVIARDGNAAWKWTATLGEDRPSPFNGAAEQLLALMDDTAKVREFFPARPFVKFQDERVIDTFPGRIRGVALHDIDGDARPDLYACHETGGRAYLQTAPLTFEDRTAKLGLQGVSCTSCSFADVNGDGHADLLADAAVLLGSKDGFRRTSLLPPSANERVLTAAFVEVNGDGYPDVVVSRVGGGLAVYLNPGARGGGFLDATGAGGLDRAECGAGGTGFFAPGDWNDDGRTDLYYAAGQGLILVQDGKGVFTPVKHQAGFDYKTARSQEPGLTGAGCFAPLWRPDSWDIASAGDMHVTIATSRNGVPTNVTGYGNESKVCQVSQLATLAADLNLDGRVDLLTLTREADTKNAFHANRGYGSFMLSDLYTHYDAFPGKWYTTGAWGAAAGDANDDGATDLLLGGADGVLRLAVSDALGHPFRQPRAQPTPMERTLQQVRVLTVRVARPLGVVGADIRLSDAEGRVVARRVIGSNVLTGCRGPDAADLAVCEPGSYSLTIRYGDGTRQQRSVGLSTNRRVVITTGLQERRQ